MKKGIFKIGVFIVFLIAIDRSLGLYMSYLYEENTCLHSGGELNDYLKNPAPDTLIIGSSRVNTMVDPTVIGKSVLNVTQSAKHFLYHLAVVDLMDQHQKMPAKMLIMNLEVEDIYMKNKARLIDDVFYLKYYYGQNAFITNIIQSKDKYERIKFLSSCYRFNGENFRLLTNPLQYICKRTGKGYTPLTKTANDSLRLAIGVEEMKKLGLKEIDPDFFKNMKHLIYLCQKNDVKLVLLYAPNFYFPDSFKKASLHIQTFCEKNKVPYLDFSLNQDKVFNDRSLWYDHIHLNSDGAVLYTKMLKEELAKLN